MSSNHEFDYLRQQHETYCNDVVWCLYSFLKA